MCATEGLPSMPPSSARFDRHEVQVMFLNPFVQGVMQAVQLFLEQQFMFLIYIDLLFDRVSIENSPAEARFPP